jgi:hypothetical protein
LQRTARRLRNAKKKAPAETDAFYKVEKKLLFFPFAAAFFCFCSFLRSFHSST